MFSKSAKESLANNYNPPVGLYDVVSNWTSPTAIIPKASTKLQEPPQIPLRYFDKLIDRENPLNNYAHPVQRMRQNKILQSLRLQQQLAIQSGDILHEGSKPKEFNNKGRLLRPIKTLKQSFIPDVESMVLGGDISISNTKRMKQYLKSRPKQISVDSLELILLREKLQKSPQLPGPGAYEIKSNLGIVKSQQVQPFARQIGRMSGSIDSLIGIGVGVGHYDIPEHKHTRSILEFDKYAGRELLFVTKNIPTNQDIEEKKKTMKLLDFPVAFGLSSKK